MIIVDAPYPEITHHEAQRIKSFVSKNNDHTLSNSSDVKKANIEISILFFRFIAFYFLSSDLQTN